MPVIMSSSLLSDLKTLKPSWKSTTPDFRTDSLPVLFTSVEKTFHEHMHSPYVPKYGIQKSSHVVAVLPFHFVSILNVLVASSLFLALTTTKHSDAHQVTKISSKSAKFFIAELPYIMEEQ